MNHKKNRGFRATCRSLMETRHRPSIDSSIVLPGSPSSQRAGFSYANDSVHKKSGSLKLVNSVSSELEDLRRGIGGQPSSAYQTSFLDATEAISDSDTSDTSIHEWIRETATLEVELGILLAVPRFKDSVFNSSLANYINIFVRIVELSELSPVDLIERYMLPLLEYKADCDDQHIILFDAACKVVRIVLDTIDNQQLAQALEFKVLPRLLEASRTISIHSEVAFETCNYILSEPLSPRDCLNRVVMTRIKDSSFYGPDLIPFRMMRAEWLRLITDSAGNSEDKLLIEEGCAVEIKASLLYEPSNLVNARYKEVFESCTMSLRLEPGLFKSGNRKFIRRRGSKVRP